jgi:predicted transcriptional regulator
MSKVLSKEQRELVEEFLAAYNELDGELRRILEQERDRDLPFVGLVNGIAARRSHWLDVGYLKRVAKLRNLLVHDPKSPYEYPAVPTEAMVADLKATCRRLLARVLPKFSKKVETVAPQDSLASVLRKITELSFSQFPIYSGTTCKGLLTENGITRWLADHVTNELSIVELEEVAVRDVLSKEEKRKNWEFVSRVESVESVRGLFTDKKLLEAVLITDSGSDRESPLGIVTRWDVMD